MVSVHTYIAIIYFRPEAKMEGGFGTNFFFSNFFFFSYEKGVVRPKKKRGKTKTGKRNDMRGKKGGIGGEQSEIDQKKKVEEWKKKKKELIEVRRGAARGEGLE